MMNVGIKAQTLTVSIVATMQQPNISMPNLVNVKITQTSKTFIPTLITSVAGHSISAINPQFLRGETVAVYA
jgi:hypothetical protein